MSTRTKTESKTSASAKKTIPKKTTPAKTGGAKVAPVKTDDVTVAPVKTDDVTVAPVKTTNAKVAKVAPVKGAKAVPAKTGGAKATKQVAPVKKVVAKKAVVKKVTAAKNQAGGTTESTLRHFKILNEDGTKDGRYAGRKPKQAASKVLTALSKEHKKPGKVFRFTIMECTRGSKCNKYTYEGSKVVLLNPNKVDIKDKVTGEVVKTITYKHQSKLRKIKKSELLV